MKKGLLSAVILLLGVTATYAQNAETPDFNRHQIGFGFTNEANHLGGYYTGDQKWGYGFALQTTYQYRPIQWFSLETGVGYRNYATRVGYNLNPVGHFIDAFIILISLTLTAFMPCIYL